MLKYRCELFAARPSNERLPLALAPFYRGLTPRGGEVALRIGKVLEAFKEKGLYKSSQLKPMGY